MWSVWKRPLAECVLLLWWWITFRDVIFFPLSPLSTYPSAGLPRPHSLLAHEGTLQAGTCCWLRWYQRLANTWRKHPELHPATVPAWFPSAGRGWARGWGGPCGCGSEGPEKHQAAPCWASSGAGMRPWPAVPHVSSGDRLGLPTG